MTNRLAPHKTSQTYEAADDTRYAIWSDGSRRRDPVKLGGRERKRLRRLARRSA